MRQNSNKVKDVMIIISEFKDHEFPVGVCTHDLREIDQFYKTVSILYGGKLV